MIVARLMRHTRARGGILIDRAIPHRERDSWRHVVDELRREHRVLVPMLPVGGYNCLCGRTPICRRAISRSRKLSSWRPLETSRWSGSDWGSYMIASASHPERIGRWVITSSQAYERPVPGSVNGRRSQIDKETEPSSHRDRCQRDGPSVGRLLRRALMDGSAPQSLSRSSPSWASAQGSGHPLPPAATSRDVLRKPPAGRRHERFPQGRWGSRRSERS
jgi:hypothetical protein